MVFFLSSQSHRSKDIKNWLPFECGEPALAQATKPLWLNLNRVWNSSANAPPYILSPPTINIITNYIQSKVSTLNTNPSRHQCSGQQQPQDMEGGLVTGAGAGGITALDEERLDDAMEDGAVVVALEAELDEVADGFGSFFGPKLDVDRPHRRLEHHLPLRRRFQGVHRRHGRSSRELRQTTAIPHLLFFVSSWLRCRIGVSFILGLSLFGSLGPKIKPNWLDFLSLGLLINLSCY